MTPPPPRQGHAHVPQTARPSGALDRSLAKLTIGAARSMRERAGSATRTGEFWQQVRVGISGKAVSDWTFAVKKVTWQLPFLCAPQQRVGDFRPTDADLDGGLSGVPQDDPTYGHSLKTAGAPHFAYGVEMFPPFAPKPKTKDDPPNMVIVVAQVGKWTLNAQHWVVGAEIQYGCLAPTADNLDHGNLPFRAIVHMTFQGYGATPEGTQ